jgi:hypothetical protein
VTRSEGKYFDVFEYSSRKEVSLRIYQKRALNAIQRILRIRAL